MSRRLLALAVVMAALAAALVFGRDLVELFGDAERLRAAILGLGPWAWLGLIALSAAQIVLAPVPGSLVQVAGGFVFGTWLGYLYATIGMLAGAAAAFVLARRFGVPLLERFVPQRLLATWLKLRSVNSMTAWVLILLVPVGDFWYYLAGLTTISLPRMLLVALIVRGPTAIAAAYLGAHAASAPQELLVAGAAAVVVIGALALWQKDRLESLIFDGLLAHALGKRGEGNGRQE